jgi:nitrite reductase (NADH) large subunit
MTRYLIVGNGVAGNAAAESIRKIDPDGSIHLFTKEKYHFYYVPALPEYLSGDKQIKDFTIHAEPWYERNKVDLHLGTEITAIDPVKKTASTQTGEAFPYDRVLLACGGYCFVPPIPGAEDERVFTLRTIANAEAMRARARESKKAVVIGGGLLGLEAGNGLRKLGLEVSVIEFAKRLLPRQMDTASAALLQRQMEKIGFRFYLDAQTKEILPEKDGLWVGLQNGEKVYAHMVLISAGVRPVVSLAKSLNLKIEKGVQVNDMMETAREGIYAAGDLIEHRGRFYGIWPASSEQGRIAGGNMAGKQEVYQGTIPSNTLKVVGIDLVSNGEIDDPGQLESIIVKNEAQNFYRKLVLQEDRIIGAILLGDIRGNDAIQKAIKSGKNVSAFKKNLGDEEFDFSKLAESSSDRGP